MDIDATLLSTLRPRSLAERLRLRLSGGFTPVQLFHRLSTEQQRHLLAGEDNGEVASRKAMARIQAALDRLEQANQIQRARVNMQTQEGRGPRTVRVDVYRLSRRRR